MAREKMNKLHSQRHETLTKLRKLIIHHLLNFVFPNYRLNSKSQLSVSTRATFVVAGAGLAASFSPHINTGDLDRVKIDHVRKLHSGSGNRVDLNH